MCFVVFAIVAFGWVLVLGCLWVFDCWFLLGDAFRVNWCGIVLLVWEFVGELLIWGWWFSFGFLLGELG